MQLVKSAQSHGIVEEWMVDVVVVVVVVVVARLAVGLIRMIVALHAMNVAIIRMTALVLVVGLDMVVIVAGGTYF